MKLKNSVKALVIFISLCVLPIFLLTYCVIGAYNNYFRTILFDFYINKAQSLSSEVNHFIESGHRDLIKKQVIERIGRTGYTLFACENWKTVYHPFEKEETDKVDIKFLKETSFYRSGSGAGEHIDSKGVRKIWAYAPTIKDGVVILVQNMDEAFCSFNKIKKSIWVLAVIIVILSALVFLLLLKFKKIEIR